MGKDTLSITDNRTGKTYEIPIWNDTIRAMDLRQIKVNPDDFGMLSYDPAFTNTASTKSNITFIDGGKGILHYRGYPIEQLAEKGRLVVPVGSEFFQTLNIVTKQRGRIFRKELFECTFVPLLGKQGWKE